MKIEPLQASDIFIKVLDYDQKLSGLTGNIAQLIVRLSDVPKKHKVLSKINEWISYEPALKRILKKKILKDYWYINNNKIFNPYVYWHINTSLEEILKLRVNTFKTIYNSPLLALDFIENTNEFTILLTWHHILADAKGGELIFYRLRSNDISTSKITDQNLIRFDSSILKNLNQMKIFREKVVKQMSQNNIISLIDRNDKIKNKNLTLLSKHIQIDKNLTDNIKYRAQHINPIFGETSLFIAISIKEIHKLIKNKDTGNFLIPLPINLRNPTSIYPLIGNPVSFIFLLINREEVENLSILKLSKLISTKLIDDVKNNIINATNAALNIGKFLPLRLYRYILRNTMQGQLGSMFFANTGLSYISNPAGQATDFLGYKINSCFHRPMVSIPPGIGFFYSTYNQKLHITICWINEIMSKNEISNISNNIVRNLEQTL